MVRRLRPLRRLLLRAVRDPPAPTPIAHATTTHSANRITNVDDVTRITRWWDFLKNFHLTDLWEKLEATRLRKTKSGDRGIEGLENIDGRASDRDEVVRHEA